MTPDDHPRDDPAPEPIDPPAGVEEPGVTQPMRGGATPTPGTGEAVRGRDTPTLPDQGHPIPHTRPGDGPTGPPASDAGLELVLSPLPDSAPRSYGTAALWDTIKASGQLEPGQVVFGRYEVVRKLGGGGMGDVWLVRHVELNAERALKLIIARVAYDAQARGRFRREAQVMARFSHPNAVTIHDARLTEHDVAFIDMEFIRGRSLDKLLKKGRPMPLDAVARILEQLCDVLQTAHEHRIVHRDLKPSNLMLLDGRPPGKEVLKVLDFGIAKILGVEADDPEVRTLTGFFMGTPPYAAPEQGDGKADHRSDLYAVGVILYELLTGHRPFRGHVAKLIADTLGATPPPFREVNASVDVPPEVERVVMRCLAKDPKDRPQSAHELAEEFRRALPESIQLRPPPPPPPRRRLGPMAAAGLLAVGLGVGLALAIARPWERRSEVTPPGGTGSGTTAGPALPAGFRAEDPGRLAADGLPEAILSDRDGSRFVRIVGGPFEMGPGGAGGRVEVPGFYMQESEVTNGQLKAYYSSRGVEPPSPPASWHPPESGEALDRHPAVFVDHETAADLAAWLGGQLPTAAEWEYAARSGGKPGHDYVWGAGPPLEAPDRRANIDAVEFNSATSKVKNYPDDRTEQGVYDLTGNVREWCRDPRPEGPSRFEVRGGSWASFADRFRTTRGEAVEGSERLKDLGFRVVVEWPEAGADHPAR